MLIYNNFQAVYYRTENGRVAGKMVEGMMRQKDKKQHKRNDGGTGHLGSNIEVIMYSRNINIKTSVSIQCKL